MAQYPSLPIWTDALLGDTQHLSTAEFGAYLLMLIVAWRDPDCSLPADDPYLARITRAGRNWHRLKPAVIGFWALGQDGRLRQSRLTKTRLSVSHKARQARTAVAARELKKIKTGGSDDHSPMGFRSPSDTSNQNQNQSKKEESPLRPPLTGEILPPPPSAGAVDLLGKPMNGAHHGKTGSRINPNWEPDPEDRLFATRLGVDPDWAAQEFRDHWAGVPGKAGLKLDWGATYRNRVRVLAEQGRGRAPQSKGSQARGSGAGGQSVVGIARELMGELQQSGPGVVVPGDPPKLQGPR